MQFYEAMCKASGHVDMHSCQIRGSKAAGKVLWYVCVLKVFYTCIVLSAFINTYCCTEMNKWQCHWREIQSSKVHGQPVSIVLNFFITVV